MTEEIKFNQVESSHGGSRAGAGRRKASPLERNRWFAARGINPMTAGEILQRLGGEIGYFKRALESEDDRVMLQALMFLMAMRDGKPAQSVNISSQSIVLHANDIESARAIVAEIRRDAPRLGDTISAPKLLTTKDLDGENSAQVVDNASAEHMLSGHDGGNSNG